MNIPIAILICSVCWTLAVLAWRYMPIGVTEETFGAWWREERGNRRLLRLADYVERALEDRMIDGVDEYNQRVHHWDYYQKRPACMAAFAFKMFGYSDIWDFGLRAKMLRKLSLSWNEAAELFSGNGCGDARRDGDKAVQYVRDFVARRRAVWNTAGETT